MDPATGIIHLLAVTDTEVIESAIEGGLGGHALRADEIDERQLAGLVHGPAPGLVAAAQRRAADVNVACRVSIRTGPPVQEVITFARAQQRSLLITGCPESCSATSYLRVQALIRESPDPVLVV